MPRTLYPEPVRNPVGRPRKYNSPEDMQRDIDAYFEGCWEDREVVTTKGTGRNVQTSTSTQRVRIKPYTIAGLALALDMTTQSVMNYERFPQYQEYFGTVKRAKQIVEEYLTQRVLDGGQAAGPIFLLKCNCGYTEKQEIELSSPGGFPVGTQGADSRAAIVRAKLLEQIGGDDDE